MLSTLLPLVMSIFLQSESAARVPPPQRSLDIPPIVDPSRTAVLSGYVPNKPLAKDGTKVSPALRSVVWVLKPAGARIPALSDQVMVLGATDFTPSTLAVTPGTNVSLRTTEQGVRTVQGSGSIRVERRLTRETTALPVILERAGTVALSSREVPDAAGLIVAVDSGFLAVATGEGAFRIVGLPPGRREVRIRLPDGKILEKTVDLRAGGELEVDWREKEAPAPASIR